jgi:hypothetical protein
LYIIFEKVSGIEITDCLRREARLSEERVVHYTAQMALAIKFLEDNGIVQFTLSVDDFYITAEGMKKVESLYILL